MATASTTKAAPSDAKSAPRNTILEGDALAMLRSLPSRSVQCVITSPPYYGLRDYGTPGQYGLEPTLDGYLDRMVAVFDEVFRVLRPDGVCWLNIGDSYAGSWGNYAPGGIKGQQRTQTEEGKRWERKAYGDTMMLPPTAKPQRGIKAKDLLLVPFRLALALQTAGWYVRSDIIWHKPAPMPESVTDRPTRAHEYIFLLTRSERYYYDASAIREPAVSDHVSGNGYNRPEQITRCGRGQASGWTDIGGMRNRRSVWTVNTEAFPDAHYAVFPTALIEPMVLAGSRPGDLVLDPFIGSGTTAVVAVQHGRDYLGIELSPAYAAMARQRIAEEGRPVVLPRKQRQQMRAKGVTQASLLDVV